MSTVSSALAAKCRKRPRNTLCSSCLISTAGRYVVSRAASINDGLIDGEPTIIERNGKISIIARQNQADSVAIRSRGAPSATAERKQYPADQ